MKPDLVPRSGLASSILACIPHNQLANAARISGPRMSGPKPSPLQRIVWIGAEAQAAWIFWLFKSCVPRLRRDLLSGHAAWRLLGKPFASAHDAKGRCTNVPLISSALAGSSVEELPEHFSSAISGRARAARIDVPHSYASSKRCTENTNIIVRMRIFQHNRAES